jgi:hypothetical protein
MTREEFKETYLINSFFWIDKNNYLQLQKILQEFGFACHTGSGIIDWHIGFNNLQTFQPDQFHDFEYYQKTDFWHSNASYGEPKNYELLLIDYNLLNNNE